MRRYDFAPSLNGALSAARATAKLAKLSSNKVQALHPLVPLSTDVPKHVRPFLILRFQTVTAVESVGSLP